MTTGHCNHGEFELREGCQECIEERRTGIPPGGLAEAAQFVGAEVTVVTMEKKTTGCLSDNMEAPDPPTDLTALTDQIEVVVVARQQNADIKQQVNDSRTAWEVENISLINGQKYQATALEVCETRLRELTIEAYLATGNKQPVPGVGIREITKYTYDGGEALQWAIEHKMALKLDETKFKNHVKADPPDFVKVTTEPQATIATELAKVE